MRYSHSFYFISFILFCSSIFSYSSCKDKWERKLSEEELESLFAELYTTQALLEQYPSYLDDTTKLAYRTTLFRRYNVTEDEFDSIVTYYAHYKANRLSIVLDRASEKIKRDRERYENLAQLTSQEDSPFEEKFISSDELSSVIPNGIYPSLCILDPQGAMEMYATEFSDWIPKGSQMSATIEIKGIRALGKRKQPHIKMLLAYDISKGKPVEKEITITEDGTYTLNLTTDIEGTNGKLTWVLMASPSTPMVLFYIKSLQLNCIKVETPSSEKEPILTPENISLTGLDGYEIPTENIN